MYQYKQLQESVLFIKNEWAQLRYKNIVTATLKIECFELEGVSYQENMDYIVNYELGQIKRCKDSKLLDWSESVLFGLNSFDHTKFENYGNQAFTVFISYKYQTLEAEAKGDGELRRLCPNLWRKLTANEQVCYMVFGDSISTGLEATKSENAYFNRFIQGLKLKFAGVTIICKNKAISGEDSRGAKARFEKDISGCCPDFVTIAYGMNDHNTGRGSAHCVEPEDFKDNIKFMIDVLRLNTNADIILVTPCVPNPKWLHGSGDISLYVDKIHELGIEENIMVADANELWNQELIAGKSSESLLYNNINHPNDYGHEIYYKAFEQHF